MGTPREQLSELLAKARIGAGYDSQGAFATALHVSRPVVSKAENPSCPIPSLPLLKSWAGATRVELEKLTELADRCRSGTPAWFMNYKQAESEATTVRSFGCLVVPGLLQTESYAREVLSAEPFTPEALAELLRTRIARQRVLSHAFYVAVIDARVLTECTGSPTIMAEQCEHLISMAELPNVTILVVPENTNHGCRASISMATRDGHTTVSFGTFTDDISTDSPERCDHALRAFERVLSYALTPADSLAFIREQAKAWKDRI